MSTRRVAILAIVILALAMLACNASTALMTDDEILRAVEATPWP